jgi:hypothetical protein
VANADRVYLPWHPVVNVRHEVGIPLLLQIEVIYVDAMRGQVCIELGLLWQLSLVDFLGPERVLSQVLPVDTLHRVLF